MTVSLLDRRIYGLPDVDRLLAWPLWIFPVGLSINCSLRGTAGVIHAATTASKTPDSPSLNGWISHYGSEGWEFESLYEPYQLRCHAPDVEVSERRKRGSIRRMGACLRVRVSVGETPSTGNRAMLVENVSIETPGKRTLSALQMNAAEKIRSRR